MRILRKILKYILRVILLVWGGILLLLFLLYVPAVQDYVRTKVESYAASDLNINLSVGRILLKFPLDLYVEKVCAERIKGDTLLASDEVQVNIALLKLLQKQVDVRRLLLKNVVFNLEDSVSGMKLGVRGEQLRLQANGIDLAKREAHVNAITLENGGVIFKVGKSVSDTVSNTGSIGWNLLSDEIVLKHVNYAMTGLPMGTLSAGVVDGRLTGGQVDLNYQKVAVHYLELDGAYCELMMSDQTESKEGKNSIPKDSLNTDWEVKAGKVSIKNSRFKMQPLNAAKVSFPETIDISSFAVDIDSVYNRGTVIAAIIKNMQFQEKNGLNVRDLSGGVNLGEHIMLLPNLTVKTPYSDFSLQGVIKSGLTNLNSTTPIQVQVKGAIAGRDVNLFIPDSSDGLKKAVQDRSFVLNTRVNGSMERINIDYLQLHSDSFFSFDGKGDLYSWNDMDRMSGKFNFNLNIEDGSVLSSLLLGGERVRIPNQLTIVGDAMISDGIADLGLNIQPLAGNVVLKGNYGLKTEQYQLNFEMEKLDLSAFLPRDSLGLITMDFSLVGKGLNWKKATATSSVNLKSLVYRDYLYEDVQLKANLNNGKLKGEIQSSVEDMQLELNFELISDKNDYHALLNGEIYRLDLQQLHFTPDEFKLALGIHMDVSLKADSSSSLQFQLSKIGLQQNNRVLNLGNLDLSAYSNAKNTRLNMETGDLKLNFESDMGRNELINRFVTTANRLSLQLKEYALDMDSIRGSLPDFRLNIKAGNNNLLGQYLRVSGILFRDLSVNMVVPKDKEMDVRAAVYGFVMDKMKTDSLKVQIQQEGAALKYGLNLYNSKDLQENFSLVSLNGRVVYDQLYARLKGVTRTEEIAVNTGMYFTLRDSTFTFSLVPDSLIFGNMPWQVNKGNYIRFSAEKSFFADLQLSSGSKKFNLVSTQETENSPKALKVDIEGIDIGVLSKTIPFLPDMSGYFSAALELKNRNLELDVTGNIRLDQFYYGHQRIGDLDLDAGYRLTPELHHEIDFVLHLDGDKTVLAKGMLTTGEEDKTITVDVDIPKFPLHVINAFIPRGMTDLRGNMVGNIVFRGNLEHPQVNGGFAFREGRVSVLPLGTLFQIDSNRISITNNRLAFNGFGLIAPNRKRLELTGDVNFVSFSDIRMDANVNAKDFQVMKVNQNDTTLVYGKAFVDLGIQVRGALSALTVRGDVGLLGNSVINYTLRNSPLEVTDRSSNIVRFVSFRDTTLTVLDDRIGTINNSSLDVLVLLNISPLVNLNVLLSANGQNRVTINGGGELTYSLNPLNESRLVGKYILSGGTVNYSIPVIGEKVFTIQDGNYAEWTGDIANPVLNITAAENISASVTDDSQSSRLVNFKALIRITNTLQSPDITFDLSVAGDMTIQNQLAGMTPEERSKEAMNLMIYGSYNGPGTFAKSNASNNALNGLIEKELNQWSRKYLKGMDLSFGINTYNQTTEAGEMQKTDYSYQFSKRLFNDKVRVKVGGRFTTDNDPTTGGAGLEENLIDDISIEYLFGKNPNFFLKIFRHTGYESVLEGEVTQTGMGVVYRKKFNKFWDFFRRKSVREARDGILKSEKKK